jgi:hypothetical protein
MKYPNLLPKSGAQRTGSHPDDRPPPLRMRFASNREPNRISRPVAETTTSSVEMTFGHPRNRPFPHSTDTYRQYMSKSGAYVPMQKQKSADVTPSLEMTSGYLNCLLRIDTLDDKLGDQETLLIKLATHVLALEEELDGIPSGSANPVEVKVPTWGSTNVANVDIKRTLRARLRARPFFLLWRLGTRPQYR